MIQASNETYQSLQSEDQSINVENSCSLFLQKKKALCEDKRTCQR
jgi:hypothetical protein